MPPLLALGLFISLLNLVSSLLRFTGFGTPVLKWEHATFQLLNDLMLKWKQHNAMWLPARTGDGSWGRTRQLQGLLDHGVVGAVLPRETTSCCGSAHVCRLNNTCCGWTEETSPPSRGKKPSDCLWVTFNLQCLGDFQLAVSVIPAG